MNQQPVMPLLSVQQAQSLIIDAFSTVESVTVDLSACAGRVLVQDFHAPDDLPRFDYSAMDGFALAAADAQSAPFSLPIAADVAAGAVSPAPLARGTAVRIMTGAPIPPGADAIIPVEQTDADPFGATPARVTFSAAARVGQYVRRRGEDVRAGTPLLPAARLLGATEIGLLASCGVAEVSVRRSPRVALLSTGSELRTPGEGALLPGQIYDSNRPMLAALLRAAGAQVYAPPALSDDPAAITDALNAAVEMHADLIVTSGGVSMGAYDFVRSVIRQQGTLDFWKVDMRPGKPLAFGAFAGTPLIGLPGNPVSSYVGCRVFVLPALRRLLGMPHPTAAPHQRAVLAHDLASDGRESYLRAQVALSETGVPVVSLAGHQGSGNLAGLVGANALLIVPSGVKSLPSGADVTVWLL